MLPMLPLINELVDIGRPGRRRAGSLYRRSCPLLGIFGISCILASFDYVRQTLNNNNNNNNMIIRRLKFLRSLFSVFF